MRSSKKTSTIQERLFYIELAAKEFWSVEELQYYLKEKLFDNQATMINNFNRTISVDEQQRRACNAFRSEYCWIFWLSKTLMSMMKRKLKNTLSETFKNSLWRLELTSRLWGISFVSLWMTVSILRTRELHLHKTLLLHQRQRRRQLLQTHNEHLPQFHRRETFP